MPKTKNPETKEKQVEVFAPKKGGDKSGKGGYESGKAPELSVLTGWYEWVKTSAQRKHWEWFVIDQFIRGNHNVRGNPNDNTITVNQRTNSINFPINKTFATFRAVRNFVTRHKPFVEVQPADQSEGAVAYARRANKVLERDNFLNNYRKINKDWAYYGVKYGVGYRQLGYDPIKQVAIRWSIDPFDLLIGAKTGKFQDAPYLIRTFVRTIGYLKNKYPDTSHHLSPDNRVAADEYQELSMQILYPESYAQGAGQDEDTVIVKECSYLLYKKNSKGGLINKVIFTDSGELDFVETPYTEYNYVAYESDVVPNELYPEGHIKNIISPQRLLNNLETQMVEFNHVSNRGRYLKDKNAGFKVINAKEGQIIEILPGKRFQVLDPPRLNPALPQQIARAEGYIEDLGGQHDASQGVTPARVTSGRAIEALQTGDSNNISDLRDNFEDALAQEAAWILKLYSLYEADGVVLEDKVEEENTKFAAVGQRAVQESGKQDPEKYYMQDNGEYADVLTILPDNKVKVAVSSELGETKDARRELMFKLFEAGLPLKVLLEFLEFPNTPDVLTRISEEVAADLQMQQMEQPEVPGEEVPPEEELVEPPPPPDEEGVEGQLFDLRNRAEETLNG